MLPWLYTHPLATADPRSKPTSIPLPPGLNCCLDSRLLWGVVPGNRISCLTIDLFRTGTRFPPPLHRPAIPLAIRQQDKVQKHVDELCSGDLPILRQASPDL